MGRYSQKAAQIPQIRELAACKATSSVDISSFLRASALHRRERFKYHNMTITLSLATSSSDVLKVVVVAAAALVVEPAVPRRLEAVEGPGRL